jgi:hypothetical protein
MNPFRFLLLGVVCAATAQTPPRTQVAGTVTSARSGEGRVSVRTDQGNPVDVSLTERTVIIRMPAGETDVRKGARISPGDIAEGDRVVAVGPPPDGGPLEARSILVMSKSDVAQLQEKDRQDWQKRGTTGTVTAVDPSAHTLSIKTGTKTSSVVAGAKTGFRRYAPDSAKFADTSPSSFDEIKIGDQVRVLGDRSPDANTISAEKIVSGAFRQLAATVTSVNAGGGEIQVRDLATKKPLAIRVNEDTVLRKLPDNLSRMLARRYQPGGGTPAAPGGRGAPDGARRGPEIGQLLDRLPPLPLAELKSGDAIMVSTTAGSDPGRVTAITLLAGVEPLLTASPSATRDILSGWNLGSGGEAGEPQ